MAEFTFAWRNGQVDLHKRDCAHLKKDYRRTAEGEYYGQVNVTGTLLEALDAAALDWLEAVDYGDGEYRDDVAAGIAAYRPEVEVFPCARKEGKR